MAAVDSIDPTKIKMISDTQIISDFGQFLTEGNRPDHYYDESVLPHSKESIISALERQLVIEKSPIRVDWLRTGALFLFQFQAGVGPKPVPFGGFDIDQIPRGTTPEDMKELRRIISSPEFRQNEKRAAEIKLIAELDSMIIEKRIAAALARRRQSQ